jgi:probable F420-dependent oxidoreductase
MTGVGLCLPQLGPHVTGPVVREFCQRAEARGFTSLWVQEHLFHPHEPSSGYAGRDGNPVPEQYVSALAATELLTAAAAWTTSPIIGTSILVAGYHRPVELAQRLATIDVLSGGRLVVGLSLGWSADEHDQMDVPMDGRGARLQELVEAVLACWGPDPVEHHGALFDIPRSDAQPKPVQQPRPPLISGLMGPIGRRRTPHLFDGWNPAGLPPEMAVEWLAPMNAERQGRPPLDMWYRTFTQRPNGKPDWDLMFAHVAQAKELGFREVIIDANFSEEITSPEAWLDVLDRLTPTLA